MEDRSELLTPAPDTNMAITVHDARRAPVEVREGDKTAAVAL